MDIHLENKILLNEKSEYKSLYQWSLHELDKSGNKIGADQIPWTYSLYFSASELCYTDNIVLSKLYKDDADAEDNIFDDEVITAKLHSGVCRDGMELENEVMYSMFGTQRIVKEFSLRIKKNKGEKEPDKCSIWGGVSYTTDLDFKDFTTDDCLEIYINLAPQRFDKLAEMINNNSIDLFQISLKSVSGFYSDWSPSIMTHKIKVLTDSDDQVVNKSEGCSIEPPRLGSVGVFDMMIINRQKLNLKQDLRTINIDKLFDDTDQDNDDATDQDKQKDVDSLITSNYLHIEQALSKIYIPVWLICGMVGILFLKFMF